MEKAGLTRDDLAVLRKIEKRVRDNLVRNDRTIIREPGIRAGESHAKYQARLHVAEQRYFAELTRKAKAQAKPLVEAARKEMLRQRAAKQGRIGEATKRIVNMRKKEALARKKALMKKKALLLRRQAKKRVAKRRKTMLKKRK